MALTGNEKVNIKLSDDVIVVAKVNAKTSYTCVSIDLKIGRDECEVYLRKDFKETTFEELIEFLKDIKSKMILTKCPICGSWRLPKELTPVNQEDYCYSCRLEKFQKSINDEVAKNDSKMRNKGFKFKVTSWYHPRSGDDYKADVYFTEKPDLSNSKFIKALGRGVEIQSSVVSSL